MYTALLEYINVEWVSGPCEGGQTCMFYSSRPKRMLSLAVYRNKLASTLAYLFLDVYPDSIPTFLHPFFDLLSPPDPSSSTPNFHPVHLALRLLSEIAQEIHDPTIKSAREFTKERLYRDGMARDAIRTTGDEKKAVDGLMGLARVALDKVDKGDKGKWLELADQSMRILGTWTRQLISCILSLS